jgi:hypothetical protein
MRIVVTLAALLALPFAVLAGEDSTGADAPALVSSAPAASDCDTSVYHLEHARANQLIGRVKCLIKQMAACTSDEDVADLPSSLVLLPTTSDDAIVAICPRAHAAIVKHAIQSCDALKQYAVKVQLFEVADSGKTIPVGAPHLLIGREGAVQCSTPEESVSVNFKVDPPDVSSTSPVPPGPGDADDEASTSTPTSDVCSVAGHCRLDDAPAITEMSIGSECSGSECSGSSCSGHQAACTGICAGCKSGQGCSGSCCESCGCKTHASTSTTGTGECCSGHCDSSACKCDGSCCAGHESAEKCQETTNYEETLMQPPAGRSPHHFSVGFGFGNAPLIGPIVWFNRGAEPRCAASDCQTGACAAAAACCEAASKEAGASSFDEKVPPAPSAPNFSFFVTPGGGPVILHRLAAPSCGELSCDGCQIVVQGTLSKSKNRLTGAKVFSFGDTVVKVQTPETPCSSCTDGCPAASICGEQLQATWNAPCSCETQDEGESVHAEPPALLTLSQHKDPSTNLSETVVFPQWQQEFLKTFRGRRLSELFEPQASQTPSGHELGRLLAEIPKHGASSSTSHGRHSLTVVDLPDCVRIFESDFTAGSEKLSDARQTINCCPNCREEFRAFLEEMFKGSSASEEIAQTSHHEGDCKGCESARDLPHVTHSKIATTEVTYPLRDLVLCDDDGRPVFDTCTIIDHLQSAVAPESWSHPSVSIQLDQQSVSLVINQTSEVHQKIADHLRYLRRLQVKQICNLIERMSGDLDESAEPSAQTEPAAPTSDVDLGLGLPIGR